MQLHATADAFGDRMHPLTPFSLHVQHVQKFKIFKAITLPCKDLRPNTWLTLPRNWRSDYGIAEAGRGRCGL